MTTETGSALHFSVNLAQLKLLGANHPLSTDALKPHDVHGLSTQDRLFYCLWQDPYLDSREFLPGEKVAVRGDRVRLAYVVLSGELAASDRQHSFALGPGSVIGLAEGMADLPHSWTVTAASAVSTRCIPIDDARHELARMNAGLRGICRTAIVRTLGLQATPESLK